MEVVRFCLQAVAAGAVGGAVAEAGLLVTDAAPLRDLMLHDPAGWLALALLTCGFMSVFATAALGSAIMRLGHERRER